jgi:hypothetical protein
MRPDRGAVEKRHPKSNPQMCLHQFEQPLPDAQPRPIDEGLRRLPPGTILRRHRAPFRPILVPPQNALDPLAKVLDRHLARWPTRLDQGLQKRPLRIRHPQSHRCPETSENYSDVKEFSG